MPNPVTDFHVLNSTINLSAALSRSTAPGIPPRILLIGPYDPHCGEYTFLAPPLGVWRLAGVLAASGIPVEVFDPNCCDGEATAELSSLLRLQGFDIIGISTTGMTLQWDLQLAYLCRQLVPAALMVAGGMEATFQPQLMFDLGPFDLVVLGEGEKPLLDIASRFQAGTGFHGIPGTAHLSATGTLERYHQHALSRQELRDAIFATPYDKMPYERYWRRLEEAYQVSGLPTKAEREARLSELRSVRLITLNYCPMGCTFCSSTNYLNAAQGGTAQIARLEAGECIQMIRKIIDTHPGVRTVIFQDDIFVFTSDSRILPLCEGIVAAKESGDLPADVQFISTNRIDAMTPERLAAMRRAGFRVLGFGIENFSQRVLEEFNKGRIYPHIEPALTTALELGITPFLDMILTSPRCNISDLAETVRQGHHWLMKGCEIGMYPYVIPFSGAPLSTDPDLIPRITTARRSVAGTAIEWDQPAKILPLDPTVKALILEAEADFMAALRELETRVSHLPSRLRSLLWIACVAPKLTALGESAPDGAEVMEHLIRRLPAATKPPRTELREALVELHENAV